MTTSTCKSLMVSTNISYITSSILILGQFISYGTPFFNPHPQYVSHYDLRDS